MPSAAPVEVLKALQSGNTPPPGLSADERKAFERLAFFFTQSLSYAQQMANHPRALCGIVDSPVGLAAWFLDNALWSYELIARAFDGQREALTRDDILDNITFTWVSNSAISSARLYRENKLPFFAPMGVAVPIAVSAFADEIYQAPRSWAERAYPRLIHYNKSRRAGTSQPGNSRSSSQKRFARVSDRCTKTRKPALSRTSERLLTRRAVSKGGADLCVRPSALACIISE